MPGIPTGFFIDIVIGICGGSASGKSTFAYQLADRLGTMHTAILSLDNYYFDFTRDNNKVKEINYDLPGSFEMNLFAEHIRLLRAGKKVQGPTYDFTVHKRLPETKPVLPGKYLLVEGLFLYTIPVLEHLFDLRIYIDVAPDTRLMRRIMRDINERGRNIQSILDQYARQVRPMHIRHVEPNKSQAHLIIKGEQPFSGQLNAVLDLLYER
jgi:uridine kinase